MRESKEMYLQCLGIAVTSVLIKSLHFRSGDAYALENQVITGLNNSIGPIARDCPKWPSGKSICVLSCPPNLDGWTFGQPIFSVPNYRSPSTRGALYFEWFNKLIFVLNNRDLYQFCPWSHIQLIVYLDDIISSALIPVLKYWWRRANNTAASQVVIKGVLLHFSITSSVIRDKVHHCEIPNALAMKIQQSCNEKRFLRVKDLWNIFCGGAGVNKKPYGIPCFRAGDTTALHHAIQCN